MTAQNNTVLATFRPDRSNGIGDQITDYLRLLIRDGTLPPETRIPPTERLAKWWGVQGRTVDSALAPLVREGLIVRKPRCGTFVRSSGVKLKQLAIYGIRDVVESKEASYTRVLQVALQEVLADAGLMTQVWMDVRPRRRDKPWADLKNACERRTIDALLVVHATPNETDWLAKLPVPVTFFGTHKGPSAVGIDFCLEYELGLRDLAQRGCRSVGLISSAVAETPIRPAIQNAYDRFLDLAAELKMEIREAWLPAVGRSPRREGQSFEEYGYAQFKELWVSGPHPDGLIVDDDVVSRGVMAALLEAQVEVPEELRLVLYRNREVSVLCPVPASFVEASMREAARLMVEQLRKQFRGERGERVLVPVRLYTAEGWNGATDSGASAGEIRPAVVETGLAI